MSGERALEGTLSELLMVEHHPVDDAMRRTYEEGWSDGRDGIFERDTTCLLLRARCAAMGIAAEVTQLDDGGVLVEAPLADGRRAAMLVTCDAEVYEQVVDLKGDEADA